MKYYAYKGTASLGSEPCGSDGKMMFELKTDAGAIRKVEKMFKSFRIYSYTNFFDDKTFRLVKSFTGVGL